MDRSIVGDFQLQPDQMQTLNPLLVLILLPILDRLIYPWLKRRRLPFRPLARMTTGMFLTSLSFIISGLLQVLIDQSNPNTIPIFLQAPQNIVLTLSEVLVSVSGLEFAYTQAPQSLKSVISSIWLLTVAIGNLVVVAVAQLLTFGKAAELFFFAGLMFLFTILFLVLVRNYSYKEDEEPKKEVDKQ